MDLHRAAEEGRFREDLLRHVAGSTVRIEPLRARIEDVALLASYFVRRIAEVNELPDIRLMPDAVDVLVAYRWPGNVRELQNAIEHAAILALDGRVRPRDLPDRVRRASEDQIPREGPTGSSTFRDAKRKTVEAFERRYLEDLMKRNRGNVTAASEQAGMLRSALQRLLRKHRMPSSKFRGPSS